MTLKYQRVKPSRELTSHSYRSSRLLPAACCLLLSCALFLKFATNPAAAENILLMPSATQMKAGEEEINLSSVNRSAPAGDLTLYEAYYGLADALEISLIREEQSGADSEQSFNLSYFVSPETTDNWATVMGVSNVGGDRFRGSDNPSYYIAFSRTPPQSVRSGKGRTAAYRYHMGYGTNVHSGFFGGLQIFTSPRMWMGAFNYTGRPTYILDYNLLQKKLSQLSLRAGYLQGDPWFGISYNSTGG
jgi:hypothetical protein